MTAPGIQRSLYDELKNALPPLLPQFLAAQRWFGGKARTIQSVELTDVIPLRGSHFSGAVLMVQLSYSSGKGETYALPLLVENAAAKGEDDDPAQPRLEVRRAGENALVLGDALTHEEFLTALLEAIRHDAVLHGLRGNIRGCTTGAYKALRRPFADYLRPRLLKVEQSNSSVVYGDRLILKCFRRMEQGVNPELEMGLFLTEKTSFSHIPRTAGWLEYRDREGNAMTLGILQEFVPNRGDAWQLTLGAVRTFLQQSAPADPAWPVPAPENEIAILPGESSPDPDAMKWIGACAAGIELLARRTAELHAALASKRTVAAFAPEPYSPSFQQGLERAFLELTANTFKLLRNRMGEVPQEFRNQAQNIGRSQNQILQRFHEAVSRPIAAMRTRIHGDYHLAQVLYTGADFVIIDFEGEPTRPIPERRIKHSPLQDIASMLRSFHYVALAPLLAPAESGGIGEVDARRLAPYAEHWHLRAAKCFLRTYIAASGGGGYLPPTRKELSELLALHLLEKAIYELGYELNHRPQWVGIPLTGISRILALA